MLDGNAALAIQPAAPQGRSARHRPTRIFRDVSDFAREPRRAPVCRLRHDAAVVAEWALEVHDDPTVARTTALLASVMPSDVPRVVVSRDEAARLVGAREAVVLAAIDGVSTLDAVVERVPMGLAEALSIVCSLGARGLLALSARSAP